MLNNKILTKILINSLLGLILIFIWSRFVDFVVLISTLKSVQPIYGLFFVGVFILSGVLRSLRLKLLLGKYQINLKDIMMLNFLSQFLSFFIPIRAGEVTKSVYLASQFGLPFGKTIVWVFIDRFLDFWVVIFTVGLLLPAVQTNLPAQFITITFILLLIISMMTLFAIKSEKFLKKSTIFLSNLLVFNNIKEWFVTLTHTIIEGFEILRRSPIELMGLFLISSVAFLCDSMIWILIFKALGFDLNIIKSLTGTALSALTFIIPAAPGYVGSAEAAVLGVFSGILGLPTSLTTAAAVIFHVLTMGTILVLGVSSLYFLKFDLKMVWKKLRKEK